MKIRAVESSLWVCLAGPGARTALAQQEGERFGGSAVRQSGLKGWRPRPHRRDMPRCIVCLDRPLKARP